MKLSIIICVYNTKKKYFYDSLKSIFKQHLSDYEVIVVDDGSSVDYSDILSDFPIKYTKTENRGLLEARLYGIEMASGKYITFVDSDDLVSLNYHQPMIDAAEKADADIVLNDWAFMSERICQYPVNDTTVSTDIHLEGDEILLFYSSQKGHEQSYFVQWNKIFKKDLLKKTKDEIYDAIKGKHITYSEDALMNFFNFKYANKLINIHTGFYFYRTHSEQSVVAANEKQLIKQIDSMTFSLNLMKKNCRASVYSAEILNNLNEWNMLMSRAHYKAARLKKYNNLFDYIKEKYSVDFLEKPRKSDTTAYAKLENIGENFADIDKQLTLAYYEHPQEIIYQKSCLYILRMVTYIESSTKEKTFTSKIVTIPKRKVSLCNKLVYNPFVYKIGLFFLKKGSKSRIFFKKLLLFKGSNK